MRQIKIKDFWDEQTKETRSEIYTFLTDKCGVTYTTIQAWFLQYRIPGKLDKDAVQQYVAEKFQCELIWD